MTAIAYLRVSTEEQVDSGLGLEAQRAAIHAELTRRSWTDVQWVEDKGYSAKNLRRPGITAALGRLAAGDADVLLVSRLDRLSRSLLDFATLLARSEIEGWRLVSLDLGVDTTTPTGRFVASLMANVAQLERDLISHRTREALEVRRRQGQRLGRPQTVPRDVRALISRQRRTGMTYQAIADELNASAIPTGQGGKQWHRATVRHVHLSDTKTESTDGWSDMAGATSSPTA